MEIHDRSDVLDVRSAIVSNSSFDDVNMSNTRFHNVNLSGASIHGVKMTNARVEDAGPSDAFFADVNAKIESAQVAGMTTNCISLGEMLQAYETAKFAGSN